jgi:hypothetical protein
MYHACQKSQLCGFQNLPEKNVSPKSQLHYFWDDLRLGEDIQYIVRTGIRAEVASQTGHVEKQNTETLLRLPLFPQLNSDASQDRIEAILNSVKRKRYCSVRRDLLIIPGVQKHDLTLDYNNAIEVGVTFWSKSKQRAHVDAASLGAQYVGPVHLVVVGQPLTGRGQSIQVQVSFTVDGLRVQHHLVKQNLKPGHDRETKNIG